MVDERKIDIIRTGKPYKIWDLAVLAVLVAASALAIWLSYKGGGGEKAQIIYNGAKSEYELSQNREILIEDKLKIVIKDGKCRVAEAACPDKVCVHTGAIWRKNQIIVCVPYGIIIKITGSGSNNIIITG